ncbi:kinase-like domain-containing protein [Cyathus striatus]|nr:kinase-like domain-containing protein [Cyathus striatus]
MTDSTKPYKVYFSTENVNYYREGGFHPVNIGDLYNCRYRVIGKLGSGSNATVWLVEDVLLQCFASLKILASESSSEGHEIDVARYLMLQQNLSNYHPGQEYVVQIFDIFTINGPNGLHHCIVTEQLGPILSYQSEFQTDEEYWSSISPDVGKKVVAQIALGVAFLHNCGIVHGDLHLGNVLCSVPKIITPYSEELPHLPEELQSVPITYRDNTPVALNVHLPQWVYKNPEYSSHLKHCLYSVNHVHVKICDFGESFIYNKTTNPPERPLYSNTPPVFRAPELIFHDIATPAPSLDIWALAVVMHMVLCDRLPLFGIYDFEDEVLTGMIQRLGKLPDKWWNQWSRRTQYYTKDGLELTKKPLAKNITNIAFTQGYSKQEIKKFEHMIRRMVCYNAENRISADEVVRLIPLDWFQSSDVHLIPQHRYDHLSVTFFLPSLLVLDILNKVC